ncbi:MAG: sensor histidine kinase [Armatimonadota bacterium]
MRRLRERSENALAEISGLRADLALADQRAAFAREIHDNVGNTLAAAVLRLDYAARLQQMGGASEAPETVLREESAHLRQAMGAVRDWTFLNKPWRSLENERSSEAMERESSRLAARIGISVTVDGSELLDSLPEHHRNQILHIVQESLVNTAKHAEGATKATVAITRGPRLLEIRIEDDGRGDPGDPLQSGVGLTSMRERAEGVGGWCRVERGPGGGVTVRAAIPVP